MVSFIEKGNTKEGARQLEFDIDCNEGEMSVKCSDEEISRQQGIWSSGDRSRMENVKKSPYPRELSLTLFCPNLLLLVNYTRQIKKREWLSPLLSPIEFFFSNIVVLKHVHKFFDILLIKRWSLYHFPLT